MSYPRSARRTFVTVALFLKAITGSRREVIAFMIAGFILLQPIMLMAQRARVVETKKTIAEKPVKSPFETPSPAAALTSGNLVIYRVGTGALALASSATAVFLDEYQTI